MTTEREAVVHLSQIQVAALRDPASYPDRPARIETIETHFAWVFLTGRYAYKLKKPLQLKGADLRTLAARQQSCVEELRLNRRLAAHTYLRVAPLAERAGRLVVDGPGEVRDWLVVMRELDRAQMFDARLRGARVAPDDLPRIITNLTEFYRRQAAERLDPAAYLTQVDARVAEACRELARAEFGLPPPAVEELESVIRQARQRVTQELAQRALADRVIESHGDLRAEHVWLGEPLQVIDAMSFERSLRILDSAEEIAMLAVDLTHKGFVAPARELLQRYRAAMPDTVSDSLLWFYESLRAVTRAKVAIWHLDDADLVRDGARWRARAREFMALAREAAEKSLTAARSAARAADGRAP
jgi:aminoglycoside phosphotransferase family enzyme